MRFPFCFRRKRLERLVMENRADRDPGLMAHARSCPVCSETLMVVTALRQSRANSMQSAGAGAPRDLWRRAEWRRQNRTLEQVARPVIWAERLALATMLCAGAGLVFAVRRQVSGWFGEMIRGGGLPSMQLDRIWPGSFAAIDPVWLYAFAGLAAITVIGALFLRFSEE